MRIKSFRDDMLLLETTYADQAEQESAVMISFVELHDFDDSLHFHLINPFLSNEVQLRTTRTFQGQNSVRPATFLRIQVEAMVEIPPHSPESADY